MRREKREFHERSEEKRKELNREINEAGGASRKDIFAMISSAFLVFMPICIGVLVLLSLLVLWIFRAL